MHINATEETQDKSFYKLDNTVQTRRKSDMKYMHYTT